MCDLRKRDVQRLSSRGYTRHLSQAITGGIREKERRRPTAAAGDFAVHHTHARTHAIALKCSSHASFSLVQLKNRFQCERHAYLGSRVKGKTRTRTGGSGEGMQGGKGFRHRIRRVIGSRVRGEGSEGKGREAATAQGRRGSCCGKSLARYACRRLLL